LQNVLRIHVLEAQDLIAKDRFLGGLVKGKSDPYVKLKLAGRSFRSRVVREDLNPHWNEVFEVRTEWLVLLSVYLILPLSSKNGPKISMVHLIKRKIENSFCLLYFLLLGDCHINSRPRARG
jgi:hypothetical protein